MIIVAVFLILYNTRENISYFYTPSEVDFSKININQKMRLGGYVEVDSFTKLSSSSFKFKITDEKNQSM